MRNKHYLLLLLALISHWGLAKADEIPNKSDALPFIVSESVDEGVWYRIKSFAGMYAAVLSDNTLGFAEQNEENEQLWCFVGDNESGFVIYNKADTRLHVGVEAEAPKLNTDNTRWYIRQLTNSTKGIMYAICPIEYKDTPTANKNWNNLDVKNQKIGFWAGAASNNHSHWVFERYVAREYLPVTISNSFDEAKWYRIEAYSGYFATLKEDMGLGLSGKLDVDAQLWSFVGERNEEGLTMYNKQAGRETTLRVDSKGLLALGTEADTKWYLAKVQNADRGVMYLICPVDLKDSPAVDRYWSNDNQANAEISLALGDGTDEDLHWLFAEYRSSLQSRLQIYNFPCGSRISGGEAYLALATVEGKGVQEPFIYRAEEAPASHYLMYTQSKATVERGRSLDLVLTGNESGQGKDFSIADAYIYCDWDRDGHFETAYPVADALNIRQTIDVPAGAELGKTRIRVRYTDKEVNLPAAEDEVRGMIYDFVVWVNEPSQTSGRKIAVSVNEEERGEAVLLQTPNEDGTYTYGSSVTAKASPKGNSVFRYWKQGNTVVSTDSEYTFTVAHNVSLTAYFTPNTEATSLQDIPDVSYQLIETNGRLTFYFEEDAVVMNVYNVAGKQVAQGNCNQVAVNHLPKGVYIITIYTANHALSTKRILNNL